MNKKKIIIEWNGEWWKAIREDYKSPVESYFGEGSFPQMALQTLLIAENEGESEQTKML